MADVLKLVAVLAALFFLIGLGWLAVWKLGMLGPADVKGSRADEKAPALGYRVKDGVLSAAERAFLRALRDAVRIGWAARPPDVFASVRLAEVLTVDAPESGGRSARQSAFNRICSKQADFVLCEPATTRPLLVIELDDRSHDQSARKGRDDFVDRACASAGLPILHIRAADGYNPNALAKQLAERLASK